MTQPQMLWHMAFSKRFDEILCYHQSQQYWQSLFDSIPQQTKSATRSAKRKEAHGKISEIKSKLNQLTEAFQEWVKTHPYPAT